VAVSQNQGKVQELNQVISQL